MAVNNLRSSESEAYVSAFDTATFSAATNITLFTAPTACKRVEWWLTIYQSVLPDNANFIGANLSVSDSAADGLAQTFTAGAAYIKTQLGNQGYASSNGGGSSGVTANGGDMAPVVGPIPPGGKLFMRAVVAGSAGTLRFALHTRTYL